MCIVLKVYTTKKEAWSHGITTFSQPSHNGRTLVAPEASARVGFILVVSSFKNGVMQSVIVVVIIIAIVAFTAMRIRTAEEKVNSLRRAMDRQLTEQDVEFIVKTIRKHTADYLEDRICVLEEQSKQQTARLNGTVEVIRPQSRSASRQ